MIEFKTNFNNISNVSSNMFETMTGVMNIAPNKLSGNYKIVISSKSNKYKLYLDDYNGRRIELDTSKQFLPQVGNFLSVNTKVVNVQNLKYGGFRSKTTKYWHIPLYLGIDKNYPQYFVINKIPNEHINSENINILYSNAEIIDIVDLKKTHIHDIFDEIFSKSEFQYPINLNWSESYMEINGYDFVKLAQTSKKIDLKDSMTNKNSFEQVNKLILNSFSDNNIIYPRFINLEFEFEYQNNNDRYSHFNNFNGYLSYHKNVESVNYNDLKYSLYAKVQNKHSDNILRFEKIEDTESTISSYKVRTGNIFLQDIKEQRYIYRINVKGYQIGDEFTFYTNDEIESYKIKSTDVRDSIYQTFKRISTYIDKTFYNINSDCYLHNNNVIIEFRSDYRCEVFLSNYIRYDVMDRRETDDNFRFMERIEYEDVQILSNDYLSNDLSNILTIEDVDYQIIKNFKYKDMYIIRLNTNPLLSKLTAGFMYQLFNEELIQLNPIPFLTFYSELSSEKYFDFDMYKKYMKSEFIKYVNDNAPEGVELINDSAFDTKTPPYIIDYDIDNEFIANYKNKCNLFHKSWINFNKYFDSSYMYVNDEINDEQQKVNSDNLLNEIICMNVIFNSSGCSAFINPYTLNYSKNFYSMNGALSYGESKQKYDPLYYCWFLIKGKCPSYLSNDIRRFRYFDKEPLITSRLTKISSTHVETIFLGVKYILPQRFKDYQFAVYINTNDNQFVNIDYKFEIDDIKQTIYLSINKYLKYQDFLRFGDVNKEPIIDLSFFYNQLSGSNSTDTNPTTMHNAGFVYGTDPTQSIVDSENINYNGNTVHHWIYNASSSTITDYRLLIRRSRNNNDDFRNLYSENTDVEFSHYVKIKRKNPQTSIIEEYNVRFLKGIFKNVNNINNSYFWCKDIEYVLYPDEFYLWMGEFDGDENDVNNKVFELISNQYIDDNISIDAISQNFIEKYIQRISIEDHEILNAEELIYLMDTSLNEPHSFSYESNMLKNRTISFRNQYFKLIYNVNYNGEIEKELFIFKDDINPIFSENEKIFYNQNITFDEIETLILSDQYDNTISNNTYFDMFMRNQVWSIFKSMASNCKANHTSEIQVMNDLMEYRIDNLIKYSENNLIKSSDNSFKLIVSNNDYNSVVWEKQVYNNINKISPQIYRYSTQYNPFLQIVNNEIDFQIQNYRKYSSLINIYNESFAKICVDDNIDYYVNATGLWKEVFGNIVSSIFTKDDDIIINTNYSSKLYLKDIIKNNLIIDDFIINDINSNYLSKIEEKVNEYIMDKYSEYLLDNHYYLHNIINEYNGRKLNFVKNDLEDNCYDILESCEKIIITFKRK